MTTYTTHADALFDPGKPILGQVGLEARDNLISATEGGSGAPILSASWHPYDAVNQGDGGDGEIWSFAVDGAVSSIETPNFADGYEYALFLNAVESSAPADITFDLYRATSLSYGVADTITIPAGTAHYGVGEIRFPRVTTTIHGVTWSTGMAGSTALRNVGQSADFYHTAQKIGKARMSLSTGTFDAGSVHLLRRREFVSG